MEEFAQSNKRLAVAFAGQLEVLFEEYMEIAEHHGIHNDMRRLARIGEWTKLKTLARRSDGEVFLTKADLNLLIAEDAYTYQPKGNGPTFDPKRIAQIEEWNKVDHIERWIGFGAYVYFYLMSAESRSEKEAMYLFRLACEALGFIPSLYKDSPSINERSLFARKGAEALHSRPTGSRVKRAQIQMLWASGKYDSRDICAEQECAALGMSFSTARKALRGAPKPSP
jgi:hypothetical protein